MKPISVHALNGYVKALFDRDFRLQDITVRGEISNYRPHPSGHMYFTLKDEKAAVNAIMFASYAKKLPFRAENGMKVIAHCHVSVYEKTGVYQLYIDAMQEDGLGDLAVKYEELKLKLLKEGLFDEAHKKPIPRFPKNIAVLSAKQSAALQDVLRTIKQRFPSVPIYIFPIPVQGKDAYKHIIAMLKAVDKARPSTILLCRGGGSIEDLWNFNEEELVRCIYQLQTPIITGVGHETDTTLVDFVSDLRAATPTAAAVASVPDAKELSNNVLMKKKRLHALMSYQLDNKKTILQHVLNSYVFKNPGYLYENELLHLAHNRDALGHLGEKLITDRQDSLQRNKQKLIQLSHDFINNNNSIIQNKKAALQLQMTRYTKNEEYRLARNSDNLQTFIQDYLKEERHHYLASVTKLDLVSPLKILNRGYSIVLKNNQVIEHASQLSSGDHVAIEFADGRKKAIIG